MIYCAGLWYPKAKANFGGLAHGLPAPELRREPSPLPLSLAFAPMLQGHVRITEFTIIGPGSRQLATG